jgi:hypothetical protein
LLACVLLLAAPASALAGLASGVKPGGQIGAITLLSLPEQKADTEIFAFCRPDIQKPGTYARKCAVPRTRLLFVGYGDFETSKVKLNAVWRKIDWAMYLDGHRVELAAFGTQDRVLYAYPPAGGKTAYLRLWRVTAKGVPPGAHTLRYVSSRTGFGISDAVWTFVVPKS